MDLHAIPIPSLASLLFWFESRSGQPLRAEHVSSIAQRVPSVCLPTSAMNALAKARGYGDIDGAAAWEQYEFLRSRAKAQGVAMGKAFPAPRAQLAADMDALRRILPDIDPADLHPPGGASTRLTGEQVEEVVAAFEAYAIGFFELFEPGFDEGVPLGMLMLRLVDITGDDFSPLEPNAHMLAWMGDRPFEFIHHRLEAALREDDPGCMLRSIRCEGEPLWLTGMRGPPGEQPTKGHDVTVTRMGVACKATLRAGLSDGSEQELDVVLMIVGVDLDTDPRVSVGSDHPDAWDDIRSALATRLYEVDA